MAEPASTEFDLGALATPSHSTEFALLLLRSRRRDPCAERIAFELARRRSPAELAAITEAQADTILGVITAVLDSLGLTAEQRDRALHVAGLELRRASGEADG